LLVFTTKFRNYNLELPEPDELRRKPGPNKWIFYDFFEENLITRCSLKKKNGNREKWKGKKYP